MLGDRVRAGFRLSDHGGCGKPWLVNRVDSGPTGSARVAPAGASSGPNSWSRPPNARRAFASDGLANLGHLMIERTASAPLLLPRESGNVKYVQVKKIAFRDPRAIVRTGRFGRLDGWTKGNLVLVAMATTVVTAGGDVKQYEPAT